MIALYFQNHFWERIMSAIVRAIVIRWEVEEDEPEPQYVSEKPVDLYVGDAANDLLQVMIIAKYILDEAEDDDDKLLELLEAARDGLLKVAKIETQEVTPPSAPVRHLIAFEKPKRKPRSRRSKALVDEIKE